MNENENKTEQKNNRIKFKVAYKVLFLESRNNLDAEVKKSIENVEQKMKIQNKELKCKIRATAL